MPPDELSQAEIRSAAAEIEIALTAAQAHLPMDMTWPRMLGVFALAVTMCSLSGLLALRKVRAADPAELF